MIQAAVFPNGEVITRPYTLVDELRHSIETAGSTVVSGHSPLVEPVLAGETLILMVFDWGRVDGMPVNRKAWALYGRSPIHGPAVLFLDSGHELPAELIEMISQPLEDWVPDDVLDAMEASL